VTPQEHLDAVTASSQHFASRTATALDSAIPFLGDWVVRDLVGHLGAVYSMVIANVQEPGQDFLHPGEEARAPADDSIVDWFAERRATLLSSLAAADDDTPSGTFAGPQTVSWWKRRMANETAVHAWDANAAIDGPAAATPIDSETATDAINEYLVVNLQFSSRRPDRTYPAESLHLHRTDGAGEWMLVGGDDGLVITEEHGKGDAAVRGSASNLLLWIWGRPVDDVEIFGDEMVAAAWRSLAP